MNESIYEFQPNDAYRFAEFIGINAKRKGNQLQFVHCPFCHGGDKHDKNTFAISLETGQYKCFRMSCGKVGNMLTLSQEFNFKLSDEVDRYYNKASYNARYRQLKAIPKKIESKPKAIGYLQKRGISEEIIRRYEITVQTERQNVLVFPFRDEKGEVRFIKYRNAEFKKGVTNGAKEWSEKNTMPILFGMYQCNMENKTLILTEGQIDSLSVATAGFENAVSVPTGAKGLTWIPACWDFITNFEKIIVFGDYENNHISLLDEIANRFSKRQVYHVREEDYKDCKDANELLQKYGIDQIKFCIENAVSVKLPYLVNLADVPPKDINAIPKLKTGIEGIDRTLCGGLPFGGVTIVTGKAGEGKSTLTSQIIAQAVEQGYTSLCYSGELPNFLFRSWLDFQMCGDSVSEYKDKETGDRRFYIDDVTESKMAAWYNGKVFLYDSTNIAPEDRTSLVEVVESTICRYGVEVILLDNLMTAMDLEPIENAYDKYDKQSLFVKRLVTIARKYNVLIILVAHQKKNNGTDTANDKVSGSSDIINLGMIVLSYERDPQKDKEGENNFRRIKITKNRLFGHLDAKGVLVDYDIRCRRIFQGEVERHFKYSWNKPPEIDDSDLPF